ncbi:MAG: hypothetical protein AB1750_01645, partial [Chloroflexota bacterium]
MKRLFQSAFLFFLGNLLLRAIGFLLLPVYARYL